MPRTKKTFLERNQEAIQEGVSPSAVKQEGAELHEVYDDPEAQTKILNPETVELELADGSKVTVPLVPTLNHLFKQRIGDELYILQMALFAEAAKISGENYSMTQEGIADFFNAGNFPYFQAAIVTPAVRGAIARCLAVLTQKPAKAFEALPLASLGVANRILTTLNMSLKSGDGESKSPNDQEKV